MSADNRPVVFFKTCASGALEVETADKRIGGVFRNNLTAKRYLKRALKCRFKLVEKSKVKS